MTVILTVDTGQAVGGSNYHTLGAAVGAVPSSPTEPYNIDVYTNTSGDSATINKSNSEANMITITGIGTKSTINQAGNFTIPTGYVTFENLQFVSSGLSQPFNCNPAATIIMNACRVQSTGSIYPSGTFTMTNCIISTTNNVAIYAADKPNLNFYNNVFYATGSGVNGVFCYGLVSGTCTCNFKNNIIYSTNNAEVIRRMTLDGFAVPTSNFSNNIYYYTGGAVEFNQELVSE